MPLPVVSHPPQSQGPEDLVRLFHRTETRWVEHLAEPELLDFGTAYINADLPRVWNANHVRDVALKPGMTPQGAMTQVQEHFARRGGGGQCAFWVMNPSAGDGETRAMTEFLLASGHRAVEADILYLRRMPQGPIREVGGLTIIPARASYRHTEQLARQEVGEIWGGGSGAGDVDQLVQARLLHLEDPHLDEVIALKDGRAVASVGVLIVGELAQITNVYVVPDLRRQGIGRTMMSRALEICARSLLRHVFLTTDPGNAPANSLYPRLGFEKIGVYRYYQKPAGNG